MTKEGSSLVLFYGLTMTYAVSKYTGRTLTYEFDILEAFEKDLSFKWYLPITNSQM